MTASLLHEIAKASVAGAVCGLIAVSAAAQPPTLLPTQSAAIARVLTSSVQEGFSAGEFTSDGKLTASEAVVAYASAQHGLRLPKGQFAVDWAIRPPAYDARADFEAAIKENRLDAWLGALRPPYPAYALLVAAYARYQALAAQGGWPALDKPVRPGDQGDPVIALRQRLALEDTVASPPANVPDSEYDSALQAAVARAQARYGLTPDGVAGLKTLAALNIPIDQRLEQICANLERWRWMPRSLPAYRAELNIADASLALYAQGEPVLTMRAVVGQPKKPTPMFQDRIKAIIFNPPWNIPRDIADSEIWPKIRKDRSYMARERIVALPNGNLRQLPGPDCALGAIKFDLSNMFGVYLHDTPAKSLFSQDSRDLSHGCMRLQNPNALAKRLLKDDPQWPPLRIDTVLLGGKTTRVPLADPVPVYVCYWTVFVDDAGVVNFRLDIYHWDQKLSGLLARISAGDTTAGPP